MDGSAQWTSSARSRRSVDRPSSRRSEPAACSISSTVAGVFPRSVAKRSRSASLLPIARWMRSSPRASSQSASSLYVISSPYGGQRPQYVGRDVRATTSTRRRDFPIPAPPSTRHIPAPPSELASHASMLPSSSSRPTSGCEDVRAGPAGRTTSMSTSRQAGTRSPLPLSSSGSTGTHTALSPTSARVVAPINTSSLPAACSSRAAVFTASPVTPRLPWLRSPTTTVPVFTPMRTES